MQKHYRRATFKHAPNLKGGHPLAELARAAGQPRPSMGTKESRPRWAREAGPMTAELGRAIPWAARRPHGGDWGCAAVSTVPTLIRLNAVAGPGASLDGPATCRVLAAGRALDAQPPFSTANNLAELGRAEGAVEPSSSVAKTEMPLPKLGLSQTEQGRE